MQTMQKRITDRIEKMVTEAGLEAAVREVYANTGTIYIHAKEEVVPLAAVGYDFQDGSYTLRINPSERDDCYSGYRQRYDQPSKFWEAFSFLLDAVAGQIPWEKRLGAM